MSSAFAWYSAYSSGLTAGASTQVGTLDTATLASKPVSLAWGTIAAVQLTDSDGVTKVLNNGGKAIPAANQNTLVRKSSTTVTITNVAEHDLSDYKSSSWTVKAHGTGKVRVYSSAPTDGSGGFAYVAETPVTIGTLSIDANGDIVTTTDANVFTVHYSVAPENDSDNPETANYQYGTIVITLVAA